VTAYAHRERLALAELLGEVGPDAPTLCAGWTTKDLLAHLLARERRLDSGLGLLVPPLSGHTERVRQGYLDRDYDELRAMLVRPPWWSHLSNPLTDELINTVELFVHHEDVRRAQPGWAPRDLPDGLPELLWKRLGMLSRLTLRSAPAQLLLVAPGFGERTAGRTGAQVRLTGAPAELILFATGRQRATKLSADGPDAVVEALYDAKLAM
jgi:uncharacterized protein (TIGR03085 family)